MAHIADLHTYGLGRRERSLLAILEKEKPDVIVLAGDNVIDGDLFGPPLGQRKDPSYARAAEVIRLMRAPLGVWTVRGNWENVRHIPNEASFYEDIGVHLLLNQAHELRPGVWLAGLNDIQSGADAAAAGRQIPPGVFVIGLFHSPASFESVAGRWPLALAGHTHGGQIRSPVWGPLWLPEGSGSYVAGWYEAQGSQLYVSRGIGTAMLPLRFLCRPELALITIGNKLTPDRRQPQRRWPGLKSSQWPGLFHSTPTAQSPSVSCLRSAEWKPAGSGAPLGWPVLGSLRCLDRPPVPQDDRLFPGSTTRSHRASPVIRMPAMSLAHGKVLVHLKGRRRLVVDAHDVYYLEAQRDETDVRLRGARRLLDVRSLGEVMTDFGPAGFVRIHRNHAVNPGRVREIRLAERAWEVQLEPTVNKVLPVSRGSLTALLEAYRPSSREAVAALAPRLRSR